MFKSAKGKEITRADKLMSQLLRIKRGSLCQICGRPGRCVFHILEKSTYPRLRYYEGNLLWTCWFPCHANWHHYGMHNPKVESIHRKIESLIGVGYADKLKVISKMQARMTSFQVGIIAEAIKQELKERGG